MHSSTGIPVLQYCNTSTMEYRSCYCTSSYPKVHALIAIQSRHAYNTSVLECTCTYTCIAILECTGAYRYRYCRTYHWYSIWPIHHHGSAPSLHIQDTCVISRYFNSCYSSVRVDSRTRVPVRVDHVESSSSMLRISIYSSTGLEYMTIGRTRAYVACYYGPYCKDEMLRTGFAIIDTRVP